MEPGLGKTITGIQWWEQQGTEKLIVVCPVSALGVWQNELTEAGYYVNLLSSTAAKKVKEIGHYSIVLINYEGLLNRDVLTALRKMGDYSLILDESQRIKTPTAKRTKAALALSADRPTLLLSGTPITRNYLDLYSQFRAIAPTIWDNISFTRFKQKYAVMGGYGGYEVVGWKNLADMEKRIAPYTVSLHKADVLSLPPQTDQLVPVRMTPGQWKQYKDLANGGLWRDEPVPNALVRALRLHQLIGVFKIDTTIEQVELLLDAGQQVVVFYKYREESDKLRWAFAHTAEHLHGGVPALERAAQVSRFQRGESQVFLAQIDAGAVAITLTASSNVVYHNMSWSYEAAAQSRDRVYRIGQRFPVTYRYVRMVGPEIQNTIDDLIALALKQKEDFAAMITKNPTALEVT